MRDPPIGVMDLQQIANLLGTIGSTSMPHITPENNHVTCLAEDRLLLHVVPPPLISFRFYTCPVTAGDDARWSKGFVYVIQIKVGGHNQCWDLDPWISCHIVGQQNWLPVRVHFLFLSLPCVPLGHLDDVAVFAQSIFD